MRILIAEDDPTSRYMIDKTLRYWGFETITVKDGAMAMMFLFAQDPPDLVLVDWEMPKLDGIRLCERIRNDPELHNLYLIMLTARSSKEDMLEGYRAGADDFLTKPIDALDLKDSIDRAVETYKHGLIDKHRKQVRLDNINNYLQKNGLPLL